MQQATSSRDTSGHSKRTRCPVMGHLSMVVVFILPCRGVDVSEHYEIASSTLTVQPLLNWASPAARAGLQVGSTKDNGGGFDPGQRRGSAGASRRAERSAACDRLQPPATACPPVTSQVACARQQGGGPLTIVWASVRVAPKPLVDAVRVKDVRARQSAHTFAGLMRRSSTTGEPRGNFDPSDRTVALF